MRASRLLGRAPGLPAASSALRSAARAGAGLRCSQRGMAATKTDSAYVDAELEVAGAADGPLAGTTFAVKDMFDVEGQRVGFGNPRWRETHPPAARNAPAVQALLDAGARLKGRTHMDELAYSLNGENTHYGTPRNPAAPGCIPGGSSSGSAAAVAAGDVDFGVGSDTGGSVRVPAAYCAILGMRPSHGRASLQGSAPLAHTFDTCGWFAREPALLQRVGSVLLAHGAARDVSFKRWLVATDAFGLCLGDTAQATYKRVAPVKDQIEAAVGPLTELEVAPASAGLGGLTDWWAVFKTLQAAEAWQNLGGWIQETQPTLGPGIKERFEAAAKISAAEIADNAAKRDAIIAHLGGLLGGDGLLMVPSAPGPPPPLGWREPQVDAFRSRLVPLTCIAGLGKLPQITIPIGSTEGGPIAVGIIGPRGSDECLLQLAQTLVPLLQQPAAA